jgi:phage I-like protein
MAAHMKRTAIALLSAALACQASAVIQLLPAGEFTGRDGRPGKGLTWKLSDAQGRALAARLNQRHTTVRFNLDYEHQAMLAEENGLPAPASGWATKFEWRDGQGLFAVDMQWTARAKQMIEADEYAYISPVIAYDKDTGVVTGVINAALTNIPALEMSPHVQQRMAQLSARFPTDDLEQSDMNPVLKALLKALGLADDATEAQATTALASLQTARSDLTALLRSLGVAETTDAATAGTAIATLRTKAASAGAEPDPSKWVSLEKFNQLNTEVANLKTAGVNREVDELIAQAIVDGKCAGVVADVWRDVGKVSVVQLRALIEKTPANPALAGLRQSDKNVPKDGITEPGQLSAEQKAICKQLGLDPKEYVATLKAQAEAAAA